MLLLEQQLKFRGDVKLFPLCSASRWLVKRGDATRIYWKENAEAKLTFGRKVSKQMYNFLLFNDILVIAKKKRYIYNHGKWTWHMNIFTDWELLKPRICSKLVLFKMSLQMFRVLLHLSPLGLYLPFLRSFQWGTEWSCTWIGIKILYFDTPLGTGSCNTSWESSQIWYIDMNQEG